MNNKKPQTQAKKKPQTKAPQQEKKSQEKTGVSSQMTAVILFCVALLLLAFCFIPGASVWEFVRQHVLFGTFGITAYLVPVILGYVAILSARETLYEKGKIGRIIGAGIFMLFLSAFVHIVAHEFDYFNDTTIFEQIKDVYTKGLHISNGGLFGALLGGGIVLLCGEKVPAVVLVSILAFGTLMVLTGTSLAKLIGTVEKPVRKAGDKIAEHKERRRLEAEEMSDNDADELLDAYGVDFTPDFETEETEVKQTAKKPIEAIEVDNSDDYAFSPDEIIMPPPITPKSGATGTSRNNGNRIRALDIDFVDEGVSAIAETTEPKPQPVEEKPPVIKQAERKTAPKTEKTGNAFEISETAFVTSRSGKSKPYKFPPLSCLRDSNGSQGIDYSKELQSNGQHLIDVLRSFGVEAKISEICRGPSVTRYEIQPAYSLSRFNHSVVITSVAE